MGARGPIPVPTAKKDALGIASHHKRNTAEPRLKALDKAPPCPRDFDPDERRAWKWMWARLIAMRIGTDAEYAIAVSYARNAADIEKLRRAVVMLNTESKSGINGFVMMVGGKEVTRTSPDGTVVTERSGGQRQPNTIYSLYTQAVDREAKLGALLGLDPANRTRLQMPILDDKPKSRWGDTKPILTSKQA